MLYTVTNPVTIDDFDTAAGYCTRTLADIVEMAEHTTSTEVTVERAPALHLLLSQIETAAEHAHQLLDRLQTIALGDPP